ncbi:hypothetical protein P4O66_011729, partial [Electrophorus voltai]
SIASGIVAILVSRNIANWKLHVGLLMSSSLNMLLSAACCLGLLVAISVAIRDDGGVLMQGCNSTDRLVNARSPVPADCPFDTTRIYDTTLALWFPSMLLSAVEAGLSLWCFIVGLTLRGIGPCSHTYLKEQLEEEAVASISKGDPELAAPSQRLIGHHFPHA